jgi:putative SOS response-associated peptidase YedK
MMKIVDDACGRYTLHKTPKELANYYNLATVPKDIPANFNVAPGQIMPVITEDDMGKRHLVLMKWGLMPSWSKDPKIGYRLINARDDNLFKSPVWRSVILRKRALIPVDGFYEWKKPAEGSKDPKKPFYIHPKQASIFSFAGIWDSWKDVEGHEFKTYSIVTTEPNREMSKIHNRMPVILDPADEEFWLDASKNKREDIEPYLHPSPDNLLDIYEVSTDVNSARNNTKNLIVPLSA